MCGFKNWKAPVVERQRLGVDSVHRNEQKRFFMFKPIPEQSWHQQFL
jgi:hypothetical protein